MKAEKYKSARFGLWNMSGRSNTPWNLVWLYFITCRSDYPQLSTQSSLGNKMPPVKGNLGGSLNRPKSIGGRPADQSLASSTQSSLKGKKNASTKQSGRHILVWPEFSYFILNKEMTINHFCSTPFAEAMDFKEWCEGECVRLLGSKGIIWLLSSTLFSLLVLSYVALWCLYLVYVSLEHFLACYIPPHSSLDLYTFLCDRTENRTLFSLSNTWVHQLHHAELILFNENN